MAVTLALLAGLGYAAASVLQQRVAAKQPPENALRAGLVFRLARQPVWLAGIGLDAGAFGVEALALHLGSVVIVGPLLTTGLLFALPLSTIGTGLRAGRREWTSACVLVGGLAAFQVAGRPSAASSPGAPRAWLAAAALAITVTLIAVGRARATSGSTRALWLGLATGTLYGLSGPLTKVTADAFPGSVVGLLGHWPVYALVGVSALALVVNQSAFQAGHPMASLPAIAATGPLLACGIGAAVLSERLHPPGVVALLVTLLAVVAVIGGVVSLARSPLVSSADQRPAGERVTTPDRSPRRDQAPSRGPDTRRATTHGVHHEPGPHNAIPTGG